MTREEIRNTPEIVDLMLDKSVITDSRIKLYKRLEEICALAIKALEQEPCEDTISRQAAIDAITHELRCGSVMDQCGLETAYDLIRELSPVEPERKPGKWINVDGSTNRADCSCYGNRGRALMKYCYLCGARMEVE